ncbi:MULTISPECIES: YeiH family protein [unclassified Brachybacterium]|uniref:YeiH family protein n=1 Tax=unclassified Brachybacterium TaxID=2623841 RepID=UPI00360729D2
MSAPALTVAAVPRGLMPGVALCLLVAVAAAVAAASLPGVSALILAILAGIVVANTTNLPASVKPGLDFSAKVLLRAGIVLLGLQLVLGDILALGAPMLLVVMSVVGGGMLGTLALGRLLKVEPGLTLLIACGFSICGAAAVAAAAGVTDPEDEHEERTVTAIALVVLFGTLMIGLVPAASAVLGLGPMTSGLWAGGSIHEIAQVVAAGGVLGGGALAVAVVVKLARVLMLAPVMAVLGMRQRRRVGAAARATAGLDARDAADPGGGPAAGPGGVPPTAKRPPLVPVFVLGFLAMVLLGSFVPLPVVVLEAGSVLQTILLAAAMFALGCGVSVRRLVRVGLRPFALAALSTLVVASIALAGVLIVA